MRTLPSGSSEAGCCEPGWPLASRTEQAGSAVVTVVVDQGDAGPLQRLLDGLNPAVPSVVAAEAAAVASGVAAPGRLLGRLLRLRPP